MNRIKVIDECGDSEVHFVIDSHDLSICGCDVMGYDECGGTKTNEPVNCSDCLGLVQNCKKQKLKAGEL